MPEKMAQLLYYAWKVAWLRVTRFSLITYYARKKAQLRITPEKKVQLRITLDYNPPPFAVRSHSLAGLHRLHKLLS